MLRTVLHSIIPKNTIIQGSDVNSAAANIINSGIQMIRCSSKLFIDRQTLFKFRIHQLHSLITTKCVLPLLIITIIVEVDAELVDQTRFYSKPG